MRPGSPARTNPMRTKFSGSSPVQSVASAAGAVAVGESGLVAVMPIGHINGFVGEGGAQRLHGVRLVDDA